MELICLSYVALACFVHMLEHALNINNSVGCNAAAPCELGATAASASDGDLTSRVLACPPTSCLGTACPGGLKPESIITARKPTICYWFCGLLVQLMSIIVVSIIVELVAA